MIALTLGPSPRLHYHRGIPTGAEGFYQIGWYLKIKIKDLFFSSTGNKTVEFKSVHLNSAGERELPKTRCCKPAIIESFMLFLHNFHHFSCIFMVRHNRSLFRALTRTERGRKTQLPYEYIMCVL